MVERVCIIPARGGSRRIPRKNIRDFFGKPIIAYSIAVAKAVGCYVIVSTDDQEIAAVASSCGADAIHIRSKQTARDHIGTQEVACAVLRDRGIERQLAAVVYPCAPLLVPTDLLAAFILAEDSYVVAVGTSPLRDAGAFYVGPARFFLSNTRLWWDRTIAYPLPEERVCDINVERDWREAETKFQKLSNK